VDGTNPLGLFFGINLCGNRSLRGNVGYSTEKVWGEENTKAHMKARTEGIVFLQVGIGQTCQLSFAMHACVS